jgi:hypothetical protein
MKRLIVIIDSLRYDAAKEILFPKLGGKLYKVKAFGSWTRPVFQRISELIRDFPGWKGLVTSGGWTSRLFINWQLDYYNDQHVLALTDFDFQMLYRQLENKEHCMLMVHSGEVHQYFEDLGIKDPRKELASYDHFIALQAYRGRVKRLLPLLEHLFLLFEGYEKYVTSDHGEAFWEDGKTFHHAIDYTESNYAGIDHIWEIPLIDLTCSLREPSLEALFSGR